MLVLGSTYGIRNTFIGAPVSKSIGKIWWYVDDYDVNTKQWTSFEDRTTRDVNEPFLDVCLRKATQLWSSEFIIVPIRGRVAAIQLLKEHGEGFLIPDGVMRTPPQLWMAWLRSTMLAHVGGLWLDGSVLPLSTGNALKRRLNSDVILFGNDSDNESAAAQEDTLSVPGQSAGWSARPGHPFWNGLSRKISAIVNYGDTSWSSFETRRLLAKLWLQGQGQGQGQVTHDTDAEVSHTIYGKKINYSDLFERSDIVGLNLTKSLWLPLPYGRDKLEIASAYLWFTRMSEEQITESSFVWAQLANTNTQLF